MVAGTDKIKEDYMKVFISQPMKDRTDEEIQKVRNQAIADIKEVYGKDVEILDSFISEKPGSETVNEALWSLGKSIQILAQADVAYFCEGWDKARGCKIEHKCALQYGIIALDNKVDLQEQRRIK